MNRPQLSILRTEHPFDTCPARACEPSSLPARAGRTRLRAGAYRLGLGLFALAAQPVAARAQQVELAPVALPAVDDPQLASPPDPSHTLHSWEQALAAVRAHSPDYRSAHDNVLRAEAQARAALGAIVPSLDAQWSFTHQLFTRQEEVSGSAITLPLQDVPSATGTFVWNVANPRALYALGSAKRRVEVAEDELSDRRRLIAQTLVSTILATLAAERAAELNRVGLRAGLERLELARAQVTYGNGTPLDIERAQQDVAAARALVITGDEALRRSREALGLALGSAEPTSASFDLDLARFEATVARSCRVNDDLEQRPDLRVARRRLALAERDIEDVRLQFVPSLSLQSQLAWGSQVLYGPNTTWNLRAVLTVPVWDGGARFAYLRDTRAAADQARQALIAARLSALVNITQANRAVGVTEASRSVAQEQRDLALRIDLRTREGYQRGLGTSLDLVTSAQSLRQAEISLVLLHFQASQARALAILANAECVY